VVAGFAQLGPPTATFEDDRLGPSRSSGTGMHRLGNNEIGNNAAAFLHVFDAQGAERLAPSLEGSDDNRAPWRVVQEKPGIGSAEHQANSSS
jgi:hypothetical protein